jgi:hypothetical protein
MTLVQSLTSTHRQVRKLICGPVLAAKTRLLSFNRIQARVITSLLTGHNTPEETSLHNRADKEPFVTKCSKEEETSAHVLCKCEALVTLRHTYQPPPPRPRMLEIWAWDLSGTSLKGQGSQESESSLRGHQGPVKQGLSAQWELQPNIYILIHPFIHAACQYHNIQCLSFKGGITVKL